MLPRRRLLAFAIGGTALCLLVGTGWMLWRGQPRSVLQVEKFGGFFYYRSELREDEGPPAEMTPRSWFQQRRDSFVQPVVAVNLVYGQIDGKRVDCDDSGDDIGPCLAGFRQLRWLGLKGGQATDRTMESVGQLTTLEHLYMWDAQLSILGIRQLRNLRQLRTLHLSHAGQGDELLELLSDLPLLEDLSLQGNAFTDAGVAHLRKLKNLETLWLGMGTNTVSDAGLAHIASMPRLRVLGLQEAQITEEGLLQLTALRNLEHLYVSQGLSDETWEKLIDANPRLQR